MEEKRPIPAESCNIDQPQEILRFLFTENMKRFSTAIELEKERGLVFPETSVILRDCLRMLASIQANEPKEKESTREKKFSEWEKLPDLEKLPELEDFI